MASLGGESMCGLRCRRDLNRANAA